MAEIKSTNGSQKIVPFLWYDNNAEEAAKFYTGIFKNSSIGTKMYYDDAMAEASGRPKGTVMTITFFLDGQEFAAINGGPHFKLTEAFSLLVKCEDQEEVDYYWDKLVEGGQPSQCGWLKDKYGLSWQITPTKFLDMFKNKDPKKTYAAMKEMLKMTKLDVKKLQEAYDNA